MKKLISILIITALAFTLFGCGKQPETSGDTTSVTSYSEENTAQPETEINAENTASETSVQTSAGDESQPAVTEAGEDITASETETESEKTTAAPLKKGNLYKAECDSKIWAGVLGRCYILLRNIDTPNEWGEKGQVYELHVTYVKTGEEYSMWSDGYWALDETGTKLTLTPKNQSENGNIGVDSGKSKTFTAQNGVFTIPVTFEQGGKTTIKLDLNKNAL